MLSSIMTKGRKKGRKRLKVKEERKKRNTNLICQRGKRGKRASAFFNTGGYTL